MQTNPLKKLEALGQSIWLDFIDRRLMSSGKLKKLIEQDGLQGMTSNPSLFDQAIEKDPDYQNDISAMTKQGKDISAIYEALSQKDVKEAADEFHPLFKSSNGKNGFVSLEVNPHLAHDTQGTIEEAHRLWQALDRPNVFIKVPATIEGLPAIKQLISEGININVTLLFGLPRYREVAEAYLSGLEERLSKGQSISHISSVASFFLSRIDVLVDPMLEKIQSEGGANAAIAEKLHGEVAIASAKMAYQIYKKIFNSDSERFKKLAEQGAQLQRLLWASTSTKNPAYPDIKYVEPLIGPNTVNTLPMETIDAYRDHGDPQLRLEQDIDKAQLAFKLLPKLGIDIDKVTAQLEQEGVKKFDDAFDELATTLKKKSTTS